MNEVLAAARKQGRADHSLPQRHDEILRRHPAAQARAAGVPRLDQNARSETSCNLDKSREGRLPIDDSDGGCDCDPPCKQGSPWTHEIDTLQIDADGRDHRQHRGRLSACGSGGIDNVIVMGVHTNMCVLGRPFSIRQLVYQGINVVLMRDMTDTMYNSRSAPFVSHFTGTDLVVEHIEKHWCPHDHQRRFPGRPRVPVLGRPPAARRHADCRAGIQNRSARCPSSPPRSSARVFASALIFGSEKRPRRNSRVRGD